MKSQRDQPRHLPPGVKLGFQPILGTDRHVPRAAQPWLMESPYLHLFVLTPPGGFASEEDLNAVLMRYMPLRKKPRFPKPKEPWHQAQELAYQGWEKKSARGRSRAAQSALSISPDAPDVLAAILLEQGENGAAQRLMARYFEDNHYHWYFNKTLLQFRRKGDHASTRDSLRQALNRNPFAPPYLLGKKQIGSWELDSVVTGEETEAIEYFQLYRESWRATPGALDWLARASSSIPRKI